MSEVISTGIAEPIESADADGNDMLNQADCWHKPRARNLDPAKNTHARSRGCARRYNEQGAQHYGMTQEHACSIPRLCSPLPSAELRLIRKYPDSPHTVPKEFCTTQ